MMICAQEEERIRSNAKRETMNVVAISTEMNHQDFISISRERKYLVMDRNETSVAKRPFRQHVVFDLRKFY